MFRWGLIVFVSAFLSADAMSPIAGTPLWQQAYQGGTKLAFRALGKDSHPLLQERAPGTFPKILPSVLKDPRNAKMIAQFKKFDAINRGSERDYYSERDARKRRRSRQRHHDWRRR